MVFKLNENDSVELKYSFRSAIFFEQIQGKSIDFTNISMNDMIVLFFSVVSASLQKEKKNLITMLEFMDAIDDYNGGDTCILEFAQWYTKQLEAQYTSLAENDDKAKKKKTKKTS